jgi:hypothetical protein
MSLTLNQIIMMNHAAWFNHEQGERRWQAKKKREEKAQGSSVNAGAFSGEVDFDNMTAEQVANYVINWE